MIASIITTNYMLCTIIKVNTFALSNQKKITFLADHHDESPAEKEQTHCLIDFFQQHNPGTSFHILIEQASKLFVVSQFRMLFKLNENIEQAHPPLNNVTVQNIEIRYPSIIAAGMLLSKTPQNYYFHTKYIIDNHIQTIGLLNFQNILDELDDIKQSLALYYEKHEDITITNMYTKHLMYSNTYYDSFKKEIEKLHMQHNSILEYAKNENDADKKSALAKWMEIIFSPVFELSIVQNILQSEHENLLVFAGGNHTRDIISMLYDLKITSLYRSEEQADKRPSTTLEITEGLLAEQPKTTLLSNYCIIQ